MRILFVNEKCGYFGGVEQNVADAAEGLSARGHDCFLAYGVASDKDAGPYQAFFRKCYRCVEMAPPPAGDGCVAFSEIVREAAPDVVYLHKVSDIGFCEPVLSRIRTVRMVHDHDLCCPRRHKYFFLGGRVCHHRADWRCWLDLAFLTPDSSARLGLRLVDIRRRSEEMRRNHPLDLLLVGSRFMQDELVQNSFPEQKVRVLAPVVRMGATKPAPVPHDRRILYVGQLVRGKGVDLLLRALAEMSGEFRAAIVGAGNAKPGLEDLCRRLGLSDRVEFSGWVSHDALASFYSAAKVVAVPSRWPEPFGMVGLEAMHHGRPVVAFDVGGISDWLRHEETGLLVPEQDVSAFAKALDRVLSDTALAERFGHRGLEHLEQHFSFEQYLIDLESHLGG